MAVARVLLDNGADPTFRDLRGRVAYQLAGSKEMRDCFRKFRGERPDAFDWAKAAVPDALTDEVEAQKRQHAREKKKRNAERKKAAKLKERLRKEAEEQRAKAEEAAELAAAGSCSQCDKKLTGRPVDWFHRLDFTFCSPACMQAHRRALAAKAAEARAKTG